MTRDPLLHARALASRLARIARGPRESSRRDPALERVLSWIRTIALEDDVFFLATREKEGHYNYPFPSYPSDRPVPLRGAVAPERVRFAIHTHGVAPRVEGDGWRVVIAVRDITVHERDAPHGRDRPLRLGLSEAEAQAVLTYARQCVEATVSGGETAKAPPPSGELSRLARRAEIGIALWTRGSLRGSVIWPANPVMRATQLAAEWACKDARFAPLSASDLEHTRIQVSFIHEPRVPITTREIESCDVYADKAAFVSKGKHLGVYLPEILNVHPRRTLRSFADSLAREKAGLPGFDAETAFEVSSVSEYIDSADRSRALSLVGPMPGAGSVSSEVRRASGALAAAWLARIQRGDGALPLRVHPLTGMAEGLDVPRMAFVAHALAAFGVATGVASAVETARQVNAWLDRTREGAKLPPSSALLTACYRGKSALTLGDDAAVEAATLEALARIESAPREPLVLAHAASFFSSLRGHSEATRRGAALRAELEERFHRARRAGEPMSLAEWAELAVAFPTDSPIAGELVDWLTSAQLASGAFPDSTASDFAYTRGTGKVFEVLALSPGPSRAALDRALAWLVTMQYTDDSMFFVPEEHRARVLGGLRHDAFDMRAWIDAVGHVLLGLARDSVDR
jgi:AMMECR1 domain-containing protein